MSYVNEILERVAAQNPGQPEFLQAVTEVLESLQVVIEKNEAAYRKNAFLERLTTPERIIMFRVPLVGSSPALLAAVAGDVPSAPREDIDGEHTVVGAAAAADGLRGIGQVDDVLQGQHGGALSLVVAAGNEGRTESTHEPRDTVPFCAAPFIC